MEILFVDDWLMCHDSFEGHIKVRFTAKELKILERKGKELRDLQKKAAIEIVEFLLKQRLWRV